MAAPESIAPTVSLHDAAGARARIHLDGAQVTSWIPAGESEDRLFVSARAEYGPGVSARGGIPVCFPQFGPFGALPQHGFARNLRWQVVSASSEEQGVVRLRLTDHDVVQGRPAAEVGAWPHPFVADLIVRVQQASLEVTLSVRNTGPTSLSFTAALHPYFAVRDTWATSVHGLQGLTYRDALQGGAMLQTNDASLAITEPLDRIYYGAPDVLELREPHRTLRIEKSGFADAVVWNPGAAGTNARRDFVPGDEHRMLCVEAAAVGTPLTLAPGAVWDGCQRMVAG